MRRSPRQYYSRQLQPRFFGSFDPFCSQSQAGGGQGRGDRQKPRIVDCLLSTLYKAFERKKKEDASRHPKYVNKTDSNETVSPHWLKQTAPATPVLPPSGLCGARWCKGSSSDSSGGSHAEYTACRCGFGRGGALSSMLGPLSICM